MARGRKRGSEGELSYEAKLWQMADALRNNMDAAEYKHVVLGLNFLSFISDVFAAKHAEPAVQRILSADSEGSGKNCRPINSPGREVARWIEVHTSAWKATRGLRFA